MCDMEIGEAMDLFPQYLPDAHFGHYKDASLSLDLEFYP